MRSPGVIYREYRKAKRKALYLMIADSFKKAHSNCTYGLTIDYTDNDSSKCSTKICMYSVELGSPDHADLRKMDVCTCASNCNAFAPSKTRDQIVEEFEKEIADDDTLSHKYPEIAAYQWVLDKELVEAKKNPSFIRRILISMISFFENLLKV